MPLVTLYHAHATKDGVTFDSVTGNLGPKTFRYERGLRFLVHFNKITPVEDLHRWGLYQSKAEALRHVIERDERTIKARRAHADALEAQLPTLRTELKKLQEVAA